MAANARARQKQPVCYPALLAFSQQTPGRRDAALYGSRDACRHKVNLAFVALGANLGDARTTMLRAIGHLQEFSAKPLLKSSLWQTTPIDCPPGSPVFINAVVALMPRPEETPESLLKELQRLEMEFGRQPKKTLNEPRPLDLDLIAFGLERRDTKELLLPHPRACLRRFVLAPLAEIAPGLVLPGQTETVVELLTKLPPDDAGEVKRLESV